MNFPAQPSCRSQEGIVVDVTMVQTTMPSLHIPFMTRGGLLDPMKGGGGEWPGKAMAGL